MGGDGELWLVRKSLSDRRAETLRSESISPVKHLGKSEQKARSVGDV